MLTLALAIAANSTIFTMTYAMMFRLLPLAQLGEIAFMRSTNPQLGRVRAPLSYPDYVSFRDGLSSFEDLVAMSGTQHDLTRLDEPARVEGFRVSANFFPPWHRPPSSGGRSRQRRILRRANRSPSSAMDLGSVASVPIPRSSAGRYS